MKDEMKPRTIRGGYIQITGPMVPAVLQGGLHLPSPFTIMDYRTPPMSYDPRSLVVYVIHPNLPEVKEGSEWPQLHVVWHSKWNDDQRKHVFDKVEVFLSEGMAEVVLEGGPLEWEDDDNGGT